MQWYKKQNVKKKKKKKGNLSKIRRKMYIYIYMYSGFDGIFWKKGEEDESNFI